MNTNIGIALTIIGEEGRERWAARVTQGSSFAAGHHGDCCTEGHETPEDAAAHGALLAAQALSKNARKLRPPAIGALVLARSEAA